MKSLVDLAAADRLRHAGEFAQIISLVAKSRGSLSTASTLAESSRAPERVRWALKAASEAATLNSNVGEFNVVSTAFVNSLSSSGAFDAIRTGGAISVPTGNRGFMVASQVARIDAATGIEAAAVTVGRIQVAPGTVSPVSSAAIITLTDELWQLGSAGVTSFIEREIRAAVIESVDRDFLATMAIGAPEVAGSSDPLADLVAATDVMTIGSAARLVVVGSSKLIRHAALATGTGGNRLLPELNLNGGSAAGVRWLGSDNMPAASPELALVIDATAIVASDEGLVVDTSRHASLQMDSAPTMTGAESGSPSAPVAAQVVSMWQTNSRAIRVVRRVSYELTRPGGVAVISGASW